MYNLFQTLSYIAILVIINRIYAVRDFMTAQTMFVYFFFAIQCPRQNVTAKTGIPDQTDGLHTLFQTKREKSIPVSAFKCLKTIPFGAAHT